MYFTLAIQSHQQFISLRTRSRTCSCLNHRVLITDIELNVLNVKDWGLWLDNHLFLYPLSILIIFFGGSLGSRMSIINVSRVSKCLNIELGSGLLLFCSVSSTTSCVHDWDWVEMLSSLKCIVGVTIITFAPLQYVNCKCPNIFNTSKKYYCCRKDMIYK